MKRRNGSRLRRWPIFIAVLLLAGGGGWRLWNMRKAQAATTLPTAPVRKGDFAELVRCRGELGARRSVLISAPRNVPDLKILWMAGQGSHVKAGDVVIRFDPSGANRQLDENNAALRQAQATLEQALAQARITEEQDKLDLAKARYELERAKLEASKQAIVSVLQGESSQIDLASAQAKLRVQEAAAALHGKSNESKIASLTRQRDKAQADVDLTKKRIGQMEIKSPIDGNIAYMMNNSQGWMNRKPFKVGDAVWAGAKVAEIPDPTTLQMEGKLEEVERGRVTIGSEVQVRVDAFPEQVFKGKLTSISPLTEMSFEWPPVSSFLANAVIEKPDPRLRTGMNAGLDVVVRRIRDALSVPAKAIFIRKGKPVVYIATGKDYMPVYVTIEARNPDEVAVKGVNAGSLVTLAEPEETKEGTRK